MLKNIKISLIFFIFFLFFLTIQSFAFDTQVIENGLYIGNITSDIFSSFQLDTIYLSEYTRNVFHYFIPVFVNNNDFIFLSFSNSYSTSSTTQNIPFNNNNLNFIINNNIISPRFY